jgi:hypothetical protein
MDALNNGKDISLDDIPELSEEDKRRQELLALKADLEKVIATKVKTVDTTLHNHFDKVKTEQAKGFVKFGCKDISPQLKEEREIGDVVYRQATKEELDNSNKHLSEKDIDEMLPVMEELKQKALADNHEQDLENTMFKKAPQTMEEYIKNLTYRSFDPKGKMSKEELKDVRNFNFSPVPSTSDDELVKFMEDLSNNKK